MLSSMVLLIITGLGACSDSGSGSASSSTAPPASSVVSQPTSPIPTLVPPKGGHSLTLTLADNGHTVGLKSGDQVLLALDDTFYEQWSITVSDPTLLTAITNTTLPAHTQALYVASKAGQATITASAEPKCRKANPPCNLDVKTFKVQITIG